MKDMGSVTGEKSDALLGPCTTWYIPSKHAEERFDVKDVYVAT